MRPMNDHCVALGLPQGSNRQDFELPESNSTAFDSFVDRFVWNRQREGLDPIEKIPVGVSKGSGRFQNDFGADYWVMQQVTAFWVEVFQEHFWMELAAILTRRKHGLDAKTKTKWRDDNLTIMAHYLCGDYSRAALQTVFKYEREKFRQKGFGNTHWKRLQALKEKEQANATDTPATRPDQPATGPT